MARDDTAIMIGVYCSTTVNKVIWHIKQDLPLREFMMIFHKRPVAAALYKKVAMYNIYLKYLVIWQIIQFVNHFIIYCK